jgi:hypothetical protein
MQTLNEIKQYIIKRGGETNALVVIERIRRALLSNCIELRERYLERQNHIKDGKLICADCADMYSGQLVAEIDALAGFACVQDELRNLSDKEIADEKHGKPRTSFGIYRRCSCGFRTWFDSEEKEHLEETEDDVHEHKFISILLERDTSE